MKVVDFIIICLIVLLLSFPIIINHLNEVSCKETSVIMNVEYKYSYSTNCMVKYNNEWIRLDAIKVIVNH